MRYIDTIGTSLKSDFLMDLFETYDVDVIYAYDRTHEGIDDEYNALLPQLGLEFRFNQEQKLTTLFMKESRAGGVDPFMGPDPRDPPFSTGHEGVLYAEANDIEYVYKAATVNLNFGAIPEWIKFLFGSYSIHYQFGTSGITMVTLQSECP